MALARLVSALDGLGRASICGEVGLVPLEVVARFGVPRSEDGFTPLFIAVSCGKQRPSLGLALPFAFPLSTPLPGRNLHRRSFSAIRFGRAAHPRNAANFEPSVRPPSSPVAEFRACTWSA